MTSLRFQSKQVTEPSFKSIIAAAIIATNFVIENANL